MNHSIQPLQILVHFTYKLGNKDLVACIDNKTEYKINGTTFNHPGYHLSGDIRAVTCPVCKKVAPTLT